MQIDFYGEKKTRADFELIISNAMLNFEDNDSIRALKSGSFTLANYHTLLCNLFYQVYHSSSTFALAGSKMSSARNEARQYLFHHAEEEKTHWEWILNDLRETGYIGKMPNTQPPTIAATTYVALNYYIAEYNPIARLGIALMLETIGAKFGEAYGVHLLKSLKLKKEQATFLFGHGEADTHHIIDLWKTIETSNVQPNEWNLMCTISNAAANLYKDLYKLT